MLIRTEAMTHLFSKLYCGIDLHTIFVPVNGFIRLRLEEGQAQVFAAGFAVELCLFADGGPSAAAFAPHLEGEGGAEVEGVLLKAIDIRAR